MHVFLQIFLRHENLPFHQRLRLIFQGELDLLTKDGIEDPKENLVRRRVYKNKRYCLKMDLKRKKVWEASTEKAAANFFLRKCNRNSYPGPFCLE